MSRLLLAVLFAVAVALFGCGNSAHLQNGGAAGAGGAGGAGGAAVEGCLDIHAGAARLPGGYSEVSGGTPRNPFWVDDRGVHFASLARSVATDRVHLVVSSFDADTAEQWASRVYDPFPVDHNATSTWDAAGAPDGSFVVTLHYNLENNDWGFEPIAIGHLDSPTLTTVWLPPWSPQEASWVHVGWDGEAFAAHAIAQQSADLRLVRLAPDGSVLTPETYVGKIFSIWSNDISLRTDPLTGTTWMVSIYKPSVWLTGHLRDGTPLPGTEQNGGVALSEPCSATGLYVGIAPHGDSALVAWMDDTGLWRKTCVQSVASATPSAAGFTIDEGDIPAGQKKVLARDSDSWWMGINQPGVGIESMRLSDTELLSRTPLVKYITCPDDCQLMKVEYLSAARWQQQLWFGFWDLSDDFTKTGHPVSTDPYRIVRVKEGCSYLSAYDLSYPR